MARKKSLLPQIAVVVIVLAVVAIAAWMFAGVRPSVTPTGLEFVKLPQGFSIDYFATGLGGSSLSTPGPNPGPRMMAFSPQDVLFVSIPSQGRVVALPDKNNDGKADEAVTFIDGLKNPHGLEFYKNWLYIAEENEVIRVKADASGLKANIASKEVVVPDLPTGGHFTRTIKIHNDSLFISIGSDCNVCHEEDQRRAAILKCGINGENCTVFAKGLRNAVGITFQPKTGDLYATENGRDYLGDDLPPDEINLVKEGGNYGWPNCYGKNVHDTDFDKNVYIRNPCLEPFEKESLVDLQAHSAPLGLAFYEGNMFPQEYRGSLFVAFHGSWNRGVPTGYKVVKIDMNTLEVEDFATGWLQDNVVRGRPVDILTAPDGSMLVSDDNAGAIYKIRYVG